MLCVYTRVQVCMCVSGRRTYPQLCDDVQRMTPLPSCHSGGERGPDSSDDTHGPLLASDAPSLAEYQDEGECHLPARQGPTLLPLVLPALPFGGLHPVCARWATAPLHRQGSVCTDRAVWRGFSWSGCDWGDADSTVELEAASLIFS